MRRQTRMICWLTVLAILFAPPFLVIGAFQGLTWPLYWLFLLTLAMSYP